MLIAGTLALAALGCKNGTADSIDDRAQDLADNAGKADGVIRPTGTYRDASATPGQFTSVTLKTDKTFHREHLVVCSKAPCSPVVEEGQHKWSTSGSTRYIRFLDAHGNLIDRYAYRLDHDALEVRVVGSSTWQRLTRAASDDAWCGVTDDCQLQELVPPAWSGQWICTASVCVWANGEPSACEKAGGICMAPNACAGGVIGDADTHSCLAGGLGIVCCLPGGGRDAGPGPFDGGVDPGLCPGRRGGAVIDFLICDERLRIWTDKGDSIDQAIALLQSGDHLIPTMLLADGTDCDPNWTWHGSDLAFAELAMELCDGCPHDVEGDKSYWLNTVGLYCPWSARVVGVDDRR